jgi:hypothetical protein
MVTENIANLCPVCGFEMDDPPRDYNICPSCGTEFGVHDLNASIAELRAAWIATGPKWWSQTDQPPGDWNPFQQLARVAGNAGLVVTGESVVLIVSSSATHVDVQGTETVFKSLPVRKWPQWAGPEPALLSGTQS